MEDNRKEEKMQKVFGLQSKQINNVILLDSTVE